MSEPEEEKVPCPLCHGDGEVWCSQGCHTQDCDACDGTGWREKGSGLA